MELLVVLKDIVGGVILVGVIGMIFLFPTALYGVFRYIKGVETKSKAERNVEQRKILWIILTPLLILAVGLALYAGLVFLQGLLR